MPRTPLQVMADHYIIAAIWADCPEGTHPRATAQARRVALQVCEDFARAAGPFLTEACNRPGYGDHPDCGTEHPAYAAAGHDLYLTSHGHGAGFWDREPLREGELGDRLTRIAERFRTEPDFYRGWMYLRRCYSRRHG